MAVHYRTQGFVLTKTDLREADQVFDIYTKDFGKLEVLGKAIRKIKSKLRSGADLFYLSEVEFIQGKTYKTLTDAVVIEKFKNIRTCSPCSQNLDSLRYKYKNLKLRTCSPCSQNLDSLKYKHNLELRNDLERLKIAYQIAEVADNLIKGQEKDEEIFNLLNETFNKLNNLSFVVNLIYHYFLWNLLSILGYQIDLYNCVICRKNLIPLKLYFNSEEGGIICAECFDKADERMDISLEVVKILRLLLEKNWNILLRLKIQDSHKEELETISEYYLRSLVS